MGPQVAYSDQLHAQKYRGEGEDFRECGNRIANALKDNEKHFHEFREIFLDMRFWPAGRVQTAMGSLKNVTAFNCYVSGTIEDSFVDGNGSIMHRASEGARTLRMGGGLGYDFSTLRPRGSLIKKLQSKSSGFSAFAKIYNAVAEATASAGHRRGALMGVLRVDHPDVEEFIRIKHNTNVLNAFNLSLGITNEFMEAVSHQRPFDLKFNGEVYKTIDAALLWDMIMRSTWDWAEPGVLFIDQINQLNNLRYCETIAATNPCGEQPLPPFGACLLGSLNLVRYIIKAEDGSFHLDFGQMKQDIPVIVRAMDNVTDRTTYPLYEQEKEAKNKRRMGLGVMGLANALEACGQPYGSPGFITMENEVLRLINTECYRASALLAQEKGPFKLFDADKYLEAPFVKLLDEDVRDLIRRYGIRNSHLTSIAPTGTISLTADNVSSGIEPVFSYTTERTVIEFDGPKKYQVEDYGQRVFGVKGKRCAEVTADEHVNVLLAAAVNVDSAVSKTCNVPADVEWEPFKRIYFRAWEGGAKGCTTYKVGGKREGILVSKDDEPKAMTFCEVDEITGLKSCE